MPIRVGKDRDGCYARWGSKGKKYYYECNNPEAKKRAMSKAAKQGRAAFAAGYHGN